MMKDVVLLFSDNTWEFCSEILINQRCKKHQWSKNIVTKSVLIVYYSKTEYKNLSEEEVYNLHKKFIKERHQNA